jgi:predicted TPR repeat methyltransferase
MTIEDAIYAFYDNIHIQNLGSETTTERLISLIPKNKNIKRAIDIGCGTGRTSLVLSNVVIHVTAWNIYQP